MSTRTVFDLYSAMKAKGLVKSKEAFSRDWAGMSPNYLADSPSRGGGFSGDALARVIRKLEAAGESELRAMAFDLLMADLKTRAVKGVAVAEVGAAVSNGEGTVND